MTHARARVTLSAAAMLIAALAAGCGAASSSVPAAGAGVGATGSTAGTGSAGTGSAATGSGATGSGAPASSGSATPVPTTSGTGNPAPGSAACAGWPASAPYGSVPLTFTPVTALRCVTGDKQIPGKGVQFAATLERSDGDLRALTMVLRQRPGHVAQGTMCPMIAIVPPQVVLIAKDGTMIRPKFPVGACDTIAIQVQRALNMLSWHAVSVRVYSQASGGSAPPSAGATSDPQASDLIPGPVKSGVNHQGPGGPAH